MGPSGCTIHKRPVHSLDVLVLVCPVSVLKCIECFLHGDVHSKFAFVGHNHKRRNKSLSSRLRLGPGVKFLSRQGNTAVRGVKKEAESNENKIFIDHTIKRDRNGERESF